LDGHEGTDLACGYAVHNFHALQCSCTHFGCLGKIRGTPTK
jgi:hypothetical protein